MDALKQVRGLPDDGTMVAKGSIRLGVSPISTSAFFTSIWRTTNVISLNALSIGFSVLNGLFAACLRQWAMVNSRHRLNGIPLLLYTTCMLDCGQRATRGNCTQDYNISGEMLVCKTTSARSPFFLLLNHHIAPFRTLHSMGSPDMRKAATSPSVG